MRPSVAASIVRLSCPARERADAAIRRAVGFTINFCFRGVHTMEQSGRADSFLTFKRVREGELLARLFAIKRAGGVDPVE